ncbi:hypothetical protein [Tissierella praeacuta]|uniref:hypothetical protein n=1 Tax=Tissierella praeacuta TaxID=43131 RepID=UPI00333FA20B
MLSELKKFWNELHVKILVLLAILVSIAPIRSFSVIESPNSINRIKGRAAIHVMRERYKNSKGELSINKIKEVLSYLQSIPSPELAYLESDIKYPGIINLLSYAYSPSNPEERANLHTMKNVDDFYNRNIIKIEDTLNNSPNDYKLWEKDAILKRAETIEKPFVINFSRQWVEVYKSLAILFIIISISAIVVGSRLFSYEKEKNMDIILVTFGSKKLQSIGRNKIFALLTFLTIEFLVSVLIVSIIVFSATGIDGWSSQIQIEFFTSIYNLTFGGVYLLFLFMGWISIIAIGTLVATINAFMQKSYASLVIGFLMVFLPLVIIRFDSIPISVRKFLKVQPINGFMTIRNITSLQMFKFFSLKVLQRQPLFYVLL